MPKLIGPNAIEAQYISLPPLCERTPPLLSEKNHFLLLAISAFEITNSPTVLHPHEDVAESEMLTYHCCHSGIRLPTGEDVGMGIGLELSCGDGQRLIQYRTSFL